MYKVFTQPNCAGCSTVKNLLKQNGLPFEELDISNPDNKNKLFWLLPDARSVPQVFFDDTYEIEYLGGLEAIKEYLRAKNTGT